MFWARIPLLFLIALLGGCTINIYHAGALGSSTTANPYVVVPDPQDEPTSQVFTPLGSSNSAQLSRDVLKMSIRGGDESIVVRYMDSVELNVQSTVDAYLNCYYQEASGQIVKIFPNRFAPRYWVYAGQSIQIPSSPSFRVVADRRNVREGFMCLISSADVMSALPAVYRANSFQPIPSGHFDNIYALYRESTSENLLGRVLTYDVQ